MTKTRRTQWQTLKQGLLRLELIKRLGGKCQHCGATENLEVNHIYHKEWSPKRVNSAKRLRLYLKEAEEGLVNLLCEDCNKKYKAIDPEQPF